MKTKIKNICLMLLLFLAVAFVSYGTYSYLTQQEKIEDNFIIDEVKGTITVTGAKEVNTVITNDDLAYIDYQKDFINDNKKVLGKMATTIQIKITATNNFPTRINIKLPKVDSTNPGLVYLFLEETKAQSLLKVDLKVEAGLLKYGYIENNQVLTYNTLVDMNTLTPQTTNAEFRTLIETTNHDKLLNIYTNELINKSVALEKYYRIILWGDYESLPQADKPTYLQKQYNLPITIKIIQAIDQYGGKLDYDKD